MPTETGIYTEDEAKIGHDFSSRLAKWIGEYLPKYEKLVDVGCGLATYLRYLHDIGFANLSGFEGTPQNFEFGNVFICDLADDNSDLILHEKNVGVSGHYKPFSKNAMCLEVGEHIPEQHLKTFLDRFLNYVGIGGKLIISWAIPGQDGIGHVSCRHNVWVINEFEKRGFKFLAEDTLSARSVIEERVSYFRNTLMIFERI